MVDWKSLANRISKGTDKIGEGVSKSLKKIKLERKVKSRRVLKKGKMITKIPDYKAPSILKDPNRFFKKEMEETKKSMFFDG